jgi:hypothetical protein
MIVEEVVMLGLRLVRYVGLGYTVRHTEFTLDRD